MIKYDSYKESYVSWFGNIPSTWQVNRLKYFSRNVKTGTTPSGSKGDFFSAGTETWYTPSDINNSTINESSRKVILDAFLQKELHLFPENSLYLIGIGGTLGKIGFSEIKASCNQQINVIEFNKKLIFPKFGFYQFLVIGDTLLKWSNYTTMPIFTQTNTKNLEILIPPLDEQNAIAQYLDTKTQAIDKKVNFLEKKIGYYKELRKSIINETVTKGLDKTVKLKDSGIDWIGQIPEHWEVKRFKDVVSKYTTGGTPSTSNNAYFTGDNIWITIGDIGESNLVSTSSLFLTDEAIKDANIVKTPKGSLLYSFKLSIGKMAFTTVDCYTNEAILSIFPNKNIDLMYYYMMLPTFMMLAATENIYGAKMLNQKLIANAFVLHPPKPEQTKIATYLDHKTQTIDKIVGNIQKQITALKELRKTLINNVVTGKIKVVE